jgi:hypothetical protein
MLAPLKKFIALTIISSYRKRPGRFWLLLILKPIGSSHPY